MIKGSIAIDRICSSHRRSACPKLLNYFLEKAYPSFVRNQRKSHSYSTGVKAFRLRNSLRVYVINVTEVQWLPSKYRRGLASSSPTKQACKSLVLSLLVDIALEPPERIKIWASIWYLSFVNNVCNVSFESYGTAKFASRKFYYFNG